MGIEIVVFLILLFLGYVSGGLLERRHYASIRRREQALLDLPAIAAKSPDIPGPVETCLVTGSVVVSIDYFKAVLAGLRNFFGGRVSAYETLLDRARREAVLRMKEQARELGAHYVFNVKMETARVFERTGSGASGSVEVLAFGTALKKL